MKLIVIASNSLEAKGSVDLKNTFISLDLVAHHKANGTNGGRTYVEKKPRTIFLINEQRNNK